MSLNANYFRSWMRKDTDIEIFFTIKRIHRQEINKIIGCWITAIYLVIFSQENIIILEIV